MKLFVNGTLYEDFIGATATIQLDALSRSFSFGATASGVQPLPFNLGDACKVEVDGDTVVTGHIELINVSGGDADRTIDIQGRGNTGDLLDSSIGSLSDLKTEGMTLKNAAEIVIDHIGADITVKDEANPPAFNKAERLLSPESGVGAFEFLEKLARSKQVLLTENGDGELLITASSGTKVEAFLQHIDQGTQNNVLTYEATYDDTGRYNLYKTQSQMGLLMASLAGSIDFGDIVNQGGDAFDNSIRAGRQMVLVSEAMTANGTDSDRAEWEANIRQARGLVYSATVHGYRNQTDNLWAVNELIQVVDEFAGIDAAMLVNAVEFTLDGQGGHQTRIGCLPRNAYTLEISEPQQDKIGLGFVFDE